MNDADRPTRVRELMTAGVATLRLDDELLIADQVMELGRIRHLPVLDDHGRLVGLVSQRDLFRSALLRSLEADPAVHRGQLRRLAVADVMSTPVHEIHPDAPLEVAARTMLERRIGCLPVIDEGRLIGILTEADFVAAFRG